MNELTGKIHLPQPEDLDPRVKRIFEKWNDLVGNTANIPERGRHILTEMSELLREAVNVTPLETHKWKSRCSRCKKELTAEEQRAVMAEMEDPGIADSSDGPSGMCNRCLEEAQQGMKKVGDAAIAFGIAATNLGRATRGESPIEMEVNERGGKQGKVGGRFDLLSPEALQAAAKVMEDNLESHGKDNWRKIDRTDHVNHCIAHLYRWLKGDKSEDNLAHALCRALFFCSQLVEDGYQFQGEEVQPDEGEVALLPDAYYITHPYHGDTKANTERAMDFAESVHRQTGCLVVVPHANFAYLDRHRDDSRREEILGMCTSAVELCTNLVICGEVVTEGMQREINRAVMTGATIMYLPTPESKLEVR